MHDDDVSAGSNSQLRGRAECEGCVVGSVDRNEQLHVGLPSWWVLVPLRAAAVVPSAIRPSSS